MNMLIESFRLPSTAQFQAPIGMHFGTEFELGNEGFLFRAALAQSSDSVVITNAKRVIQYVNAAFEAISGFTADEVIGQPASILKSGEHARGFYEDMRDAFAHGRHFHAIFVNRSKSGALFREEKTIRPITDSTGKITHFIATSRAADGSSEARQKNIRVAYYDSLTGLPNRESFLKRMDEYLRAAPGSRGVMLMLDINNLKRINDTLGHDIGDEALRAVAIRLDSFWREANSASSFPANVARTGGDEFTLAIQTNGDEAAPRLIAEQVLDLLSRPLKLVGQEVFLSASVGVVKFPEDACAAEDLVRHADLALHRAKEAGRNLYLFYHDAMRNRLREDLQVESALHGALERGELSLAFQPIVRTVDCALVCVEALLRWNSPVLGPVPPACFIPQLERNGLIVPVGRWALETACATIQGLRNRDGIPLRVAVNISARHLLHPSFLADVRSALDTSRLAPNRLELEITESVLIENAAAAADILLELRLLGVRMAADDFGTGYSSLSYLWKFPFHTLKIDRSFIEEMRHDPQVRVIVGSILNLARGLGLDVVAEGVETAAQRDLLNEAGCSLIQGYWSGRPLSAKLIGALATAQFCERPGDDWTDGADRGTVCSPAIGFVAGRVSETGSTVPFAR